MEDAVSIDSSVFIEHFRAKDKTDTKLKRCVRTYRNVYVSAVVKYEILCGSKDADGQYWQDTFDSYTVLPFDDDTVETARRIYQQLKRNSCLIDTGDILIAATAMLNGLPLATSNYKHFERIDGLEII
ncbi:MAG: type II toxin-antitoxin system VapC family toxin [Planctomycetaceae bacterium]|jgi:predicted nucleic acid-binding protein|nr:type II toxin-antitoxin system VapC family toxin [Planctomycetaceae bacterium]